MPDIDEKDNDPNEAYVRLYLKTKIKVKSTVLYYDSTTLAAEIGGYIGMLLGVSLVDLVRNSSLPSGYIPGLVQEVLLTQFSSEVFHKMIKKKMINNLDQALPIC